MYLLDSNFIIDFLNDKFDSDLSNQIDDIINKSEISPITKIELFSWNRLQIDEINEINSLLKFIPIIQITMEIIDYTIEIRRKYKIKIPDAIIASTAIINNLKLISNDSDFTKINELQQIKIKNL